MTEKAKMKLGYEDDKPISDPKNDLFKFKNHAKRITKIACNPTDSGNYSIGIAGPWGSGKSSMLGFVKSYLKSEKFFLYSFRNREKFKKLGCQGKKKYIRNLRKQMPIVIEFDPWFFGSEKEIIEAFLNRIAKSIGTSNPNISDDLIKLGKVMGAISTINPVFKIPELVIDCVQSFLYGKMPEDFFDIKNRLERNLRSFSRKVVILIDDMDRLQSKEILTMLKVIRLVTDLPNINTVVAYDQITTANNIKKEVGGNGLDYIRKMITFPTYMPKVTTSNLSKLLTRHIVNLQFKHKPSFNTISTSEKLQEAKKFSKSKEFELSVETVKTIREAKNLINIFRFGASLFEEKVNWNEFWGLCWLYYYYPKVFAELRDVRLLFSNRNGLIISDWGEEAFKRLELDKIDSIMVTEYLKFFSRAAKISVTGERNYQEQNINTRLAELRENNSNSIELFENHNKYFSMLIEQ